MFRADLKLSLALGMAGVVGATLPVAAPVAFAQSPRDANAEAFVQQGAREVLAHLGKDDPLLDIAMQLGEIALKDEYFIERERWACASSWLCALCGVLGAWGAARVCVAHSLWAEEAHMASVHSRDRGLYTRRLGRGFGSSSTIVKHAASCVS